MRNSRMTTKLTQSVRGVSPGKRVKWLTGLENHREKQVLAWWLRQRTTVGRRWMSQRLWMGEESGVTRAVRLVKANPDDEVKRLKEQLRKGVTE